MDKKEKSAPQPKKVSKFLTNTKRFGDLVVDNLKHINDKNYAPQVEPEFEVLARGLDKTQAAIITMLVQAITWRNLLWWKLTPFKINEKTEISGRALMSINRASYIWSLYVFATLGKEAVSLVWQTMRELTMDPLYEWLNSWQLYQLATWLLLYAVSRTITIFQTTNDWSHLYNKYKYKLVKFSGKSKSWIGDTNVK